MTQVEQGIVFSPSPTVLGLGIGFVGLILVLAILSWKRSDFNRRVGFLELLRVVIALGIFLTLFKF